jgi:hypothetical protein
MLCLLRPFAAKPAAGTRYIDMARRLLKYITRGSTLERTCGSLKLKAHYRRRFKRIEDAPFAAYCCRLICEENLKHFLWSRHHIK